MTSRDRLAEERRRTAQRLMDLRADYQGFVDASKDTNADDEHDPEGATIAFERSQVGALVRRTEEHLAEIDAAIERVESRTYGVCAVCGGMIPTGRLAARPSAATCVACATSGGATRRG